MVKVDGRGDGSSSSQVEEKWLEWKLTTRMRKDEKDGEIVVKVEGRGDRRSSLPGGGEKEPGGEARISNQRS